jgi:hypothetical protein
LGNRRRTLATARVRSRKILPGGGIPAALFGGAVAFVVGVRLVALIGPALLVNPEPGWTVPCVLLWILLAAAVAFAGGVSAGALFLWSRSRFATTEPGPLIFCRSTLAAILVAALGAGVFLRGVSFGRVPPFFFPDDITLVRPALELTGSWRDFADSIRPVPYERADAHEVIGVLYLRLLRGVLHVFGVTIVGVRFLSFLGGVLSLLTGTLLGRMLLPRGGGTIVAVVLAGMRWHLILSRWGWHSILLVVLLDSTTLLLLLSRRSGRVAPAVAAGLLLGLGAHLYISAWVSAAALLALSLWPSPAKERNSTRLRRLGGCLAGLALSAAPLFVFHEGRPRPYFGRVSRHNVIAEMSYARSPMPLFRIAADSLIAPWLIPEPAGWMDLPGRSRLGLVLGIPVALAFVRALLSPRQDLSALLLLQAAAACAASVAGGQAGSPHGFRFGYLTTLTAVAAAAGTLELVRLAPPAHRRAAEAAAIGLLAVSGVVGARDALLRWPDHRATFDSFHGEDTLLGRAAMRWDPYGKVRISPGLGRSEMTIDTVRRYRLTPEPDPARPAGAGERERRAFRIARPLAPLNEGERVVERVRDGWGRDWAVVIGARPRG